MRARDSEAMLAEEIPANRRLLVSVQSPGLSHVPAPRRHSQNALDPEVDKLVLESVEFSERNCCVALPLAQDQQKYREAPALRDRGSLATACPSLNDRTATTPRSRPPQAVGALVETLGDGALAAGDDGGCFAPERFASEPTSWSLDTSRSIS